MKVGEVLREAIRASGLSVHALWKATGVPPSSLSRFRQGAGLELNTIEVLAQHFGLELRPVDRAAQAEAPCSSR
jgi:hypothetical protein